MKITDLIAQHIIEVYEGGNWTGVNLKDTLSDINYKEAAMVTTASDNTIGSLVHHLNFYNDIVLERLSGNEPEINESNGFDVVALTCEADWIKLNGRNIESARRLASAIRKFPGERIFELRATGPVSYYKMLHGICEHAHYHLGQIVLLKKLAREMMRRPA